MQFQKLYEIDQYLVYIYKTHEKRLLLNNFFLKDELKMYKMYNNRQDIDLFKTISETTSNFLSFKTSSTVLAQTVWT